MNAAREAFLDYAYIEDYGAYIQEQNPQTAEKSKNLEFRAREKRFMWKWGNKERSGKRFPAFLWKYAAARPYGAK